eukprot:CAMPEP_0176442678 /NCGR_PEP_ID=MMETSP0127-20121128/21966_1 /TAXON_ID=938130 /ORGANISM="Platyophrya macrostoma, Strain WH" /LENGTH=460 /DNA_ID=CAMNT_0017827753 /DNA_START=497 /DNA_END=1879 /DNA_ORIENTATION=-
MSSPVLKELLQQYGETVVVKTIIEKLGSDVIAKYIPFVGLSIGAVQSVSNLKNGNFRASFLNLASGFLSLYPGIGTACSLMVDITNTLWDVKNTLYHSAQTKAKKKIHDILEGLIKTQRLADVGRKHMQKIKRSKKHLCSFDAGGMFGVVSAVIAAEIENQLKTASFYEYFDQMAGTSVGSILASALCLKNDDETGNINYKSWNKYGAADVLKIFLLHNEKIFNSPKSNIVGSRYSNTSLMNLLNDYFKDAKFTDTLIPLNIFASTGNPPYQTINFSCDDEICETWDKKHPIYLREAVLASVSAPTYFPTVELELLPKAKTKFCDGGLAASNPAFIAYLDMLQKNKELKAENAIVLSIGTGTVPGFSDMGGGILEWARYGVRRLMEQNVNDAHNHLVNTFKGHLENQYFRFQPDLTKAFEMDDTADVTLLKMIEETQIYLDKDETKDRIRILVEKLQETD